MKIRGWVLVFPALVCFAENLVQIDSRADGRRYVLDLDRSELMHSMVATGGQAVQSVPAWLIPYAGAIPVNQTAPPRPGQRPPDSFWAEYRAGGTPAQLAAHYRRVLLGQGWKVNRASPEFVQGSGGGALASIYFKPDAGFVTVSITYSKQYGMTLDKSRFEPAGYDDESGYLSIRDVQTGQTYAIDRAGIRKHDLYWAEQTQIAMRMPKWFRPYPDSTVSLRLGPRKERAYGGTPELVWGFRTRGKMEEICGYYRDLFVSQGLRIETDCRSGVVEAVTADQTEVYRASVRPGMYLSSSSLPSNGNFAEYTPMKVFHGLSGMLTYRRQAPRAVR